MNNMEIIPTKENIIETLYVDLLKRNKDLVRFYEFLLSKKSSKSFAIDGKWGSGKTIFVNQLAMLINALNPISIMDEETRDDVKTALSLSNDDSKNEYAISVYYDAWKNDNDTDPILSLVYEISKQMAINFEISDTSLFFKKAGSIIDAFSGKNISTLIELFKSDNPLSRFKEEKELEESIKDFFTEVLSEKGDRLVVIIDELDRCRPNYAVKLLERMKHYFNDDRITFVFSVNLEELQHIIKHHYGQDFDASRYLDRFFNYRISMPPADKEAFYRKLGLESNFVINQVSKKVIKLYQMEMRECLRFYEQIEIASRNLARSGSKYDFSFSEGKGKQILILYVLPLIIGLKIVNISLYNDFVDGKNSQPLVDMYTDADFKEQLVEHLLSNNESLDEEEGKTIVTVEDKLKELYDAVFVKEYDNRIYQTVLGEYKFDKNSKKLLSSLDSMLSEYSNYDI